MLVLNLRVTCVFVVTLFLIGCLTTTYKARLSLDTDGETPVETNIYHCLTSLGFTDRSTEPYNREFIEEDQELVSVWEPFVSSFWSDPPFATATVRRHLDHWSVLFVPSNGRGPYAEYFSRAFSDCISLHTPESAVEITSQRGLDLR